MATETYIPDSISSKKSEGEDKELLSEFLEQKVTEPFSTQLETDIEVKRGSAIAEGDIGTSEATTFSEALSIPMVTNDRTSSILEGSEATTTQDQAERKLAEIEPLEEVKSKDNEQVEIVASKEACEEAGSEKVQSEEGKNLSENDSFNINGKTIAIINEDEVQEKEKEQAEDAVTRSQNAASDNVKETETSQCDTTFPYTEEQGLVGKSKEILKVEEEDKAINVQDTEEKGSPLQASGQHETGVKKAKGEEKPEEVKKTVFSSAEIEQQVEGNFKEDEAGAEEEKQEAKISETEFKNQDLEVAYHVEDTENEHTKDELKREDNDTQENRGSSEALQPTESEQKIIGIPEETGSKTIGEDDKMHSSSSDLLSERTALVHVEACETGPVDVNTIVKFGEVFTLDENKKVQNPETAKDEADEVDNETEAEELSGAQKTSPENKDERTGEMPSTQISDQILKESSAPLSKSHISLTEESESTKGTLQDVELSYDKAGPLVKEMEDEKLHMDIETQTQKSNVNEEDNEEHFYVTPGQEKSIDASDLALSRNIKTSEAIHCSATNKLEAQEVEKEVSVDTGHHKSEDSESKSPRNTMKENFALVPSFEPQGSSLVSVEEGSSKVNNQNLEEVGEKTTPESQKMSTELGQPKGQNVENIHSTELQMQSPSNQEEKAISLDQVPVEDFETCTSENNETVKLKTTEDIYGEPVVSPALLIQTEDSAKFVENAVSIISSTSEHSEENISKYKVEDKEEHGGEQKTDSPTMMTQGTPGEKAQVDDKYAEDFDAFSESVTPNDTTVQSEAVSTVKHEDSSTIAYQVTEMENVDVDNRSVVTELPDAIDGVREREILDPVTKSTEQDSEGSLTMHRTDICGEESNEVLEATSEPRYEDVEVFVKDANVPQVHQLTENLTESNQLQEPPSMTLPKKQECLTNTTSERIEDEITKKDKDLSHESLDHTNDASTEENKCFLDGKTADIEVSTSEHELIGEVDEVLEEKSTALTETTSAEPQRETSSIDFVESLPVCELLMELGIGMHSGSQEPSIEEREKLPIKAVESVSEVQSPEVVPKSIDSKAKEEYLISPTAVHRDEDHLDGENETISNEISNEEKTEDTTEIEQIAEQPSIELRISGEKENITGEGKSVEDSHEHSIADEKISESCPEDMKKENVEQTPVKSDETKWNNSNTEANALTEEMPSELGLPKEQNVEEIHSKGLQMPSSPDQEEKVTSLDQVPIENFEAMHASEITEIMKIKTAEDLHNDQVASHALCMQQDLVKSVGNPVNVISSTCEHSEENIIGDKMEDSKKHSQEEKTAPSRAVTQETTSEKAQLTDKSAGDTTSGDAMKVTPPHTIVQGEAVSNLEHEDSYTLVSQATETEHADVDKELEVSDAVTNSMELATEGISTVNRTYTHGEERNEVPDATSEPGNEDVEVFLEGANVLQVNQLMENLTEFDQLQEPSSVTLPKEQESLTNTTSEKVEDDITKKGEDLSHESLNHTNDMSTKEEKGFLDGKTAEIEVSTSEHELISGVDEVPEENSTALTETTSAEHQGEISSSDFAESLPVCEMLMELGQGMHSGSQEPSIEEREKLPIKAIESVSGGGEVVSTSEDSKVKKEYLISPTAEYRDEEHLDEENETLTNEISNEEKTEDTTKFEQIVEQPSIVSTDAILIEEELRKSGERENIADEVKAVEDSHRHSIAEEMISESYPEDTKEEHVEQTPTKSDKTKWGDTNTEVNALTEEMPLELGQPKEQKVEAIHTEGLQMPSSSDQEEVTRSDQVPIENSEATNANENTEIVKLKSAEDLYDNSVASHALCVHQDLVEYIETPVNIISSTSEDSEENISEDKMEDIDHGQEEKTAPSRVMTQDDNSEKTPLTDRSPGDLDTTSEDAMKVPPTHTIVQGEAVSTLEHEDSYTLVSQAAEMEHADVDKDTVATEMPGTAENRVKELEVTGAVRNSIEQDTEEISTTVNRTYIHGEERNEVPEATSEPGYKDVEVFLEGVNVLQVNQLTENLKESDQLQEAPSLTLPKEQACLSNTTSEKVEEDITKKYEDLSRGSLEHTDDTSTEEDKCILDVKTSEIEVSTSEHDLASGLDEVPEEKCTALKETTSVIHSGSHEPATEESVKLPIKATEPISDVQSPGVVSEDATAKEECLISATAECRDEDHPHEENETITNEISNEEMQKREHAADIEQIVEHPSIVSPDAILTEEALGRSGEKENITGEGKSVEDSYQDSVANETISDSGPHETKEKDVKQAPMKSEKTKLSDTNTEAKTSTEENLEPYGELKPACQSITDDQISGTDAQPEKSDIATENNVKYQTPESQLEHISKKDSAHRERDMEEDVTPENQISSREDHNVTMKDVILTEEIEQMLVEIQKESGRNEFKEQTVEEDMCSAELQKTSESCQKEIASETNSIPAGNIEMAQVRADSHLELGDLHAAKVLSGESEASPTIEESKADMKEGSEQPVPIIAVVKTETVAEAPEEERIKALEDATTLEPQLNLSNIESIASPSDDQDSIELTKAVPQSMQEPLGEEGLLVSNLTDKEIILEGAIEKRKETSDLEFQKNEKLNEPTSEIQSPEAILEPEMKEDHNVTMKDVILTEEIEQMSVEIQKESGRNEFKEQTVEEDMFSAELQKTSESCQKEIASETNSIPAGNTEMAQVRADSHLELGDLHAAKVLSGESEASPTIEESKADMKEGSEQPVLIIGEVKTEAVAEAPEEERIKALEDATTLEPQLNLSNIESIASPSDDQDIIERTKVVPQSMQEPIGEEGLLISNLTDKEIILEGAIEKRKETSDLEFQKNEKLNEPTSEIQSPEVTLEPETKEEHQAVKDTNETLMGEQPSEKKHVSIEPNELQFPLVEDQTNGLILEADNIKADSNIGNMDQHLEYVERNLTKTLSENKTIIKEEGQTNLDAENENDAIKDVIITEEVVEAEEVEESKSIKDNINEEDSGMPNQHIPGTDEVVFQIEESNESFEAKGAAKATEDLKLRTEDFNLQADTFTVTEVSNKDMKPNVEKSVNITTSEGLEKMVAEENIEIEDANKKKEILDKADENKIGTSDIISEYKEKHLKEDGAGETRDHGDALKFEEKTAEVFEITSGAEVVTESDKVPVILDDTLQEASCVMLQEIHDPETTTHVENINDENENKDKHLENMCLEKNLVTSTKEVTWISNKHTGVSTLTSEIDDGKQNMGHDEMQNEDIQTQPQEQVCKVKTVDSQSDDKITEQGEPMHFGSQEPLEENTLPSQNDMKVEDSFIPVSVDKEILQGEVYINFKEAPIIEVQKHENVLDDTTQAQSPDVVSNAVFSESKQQHLVTKEATLEFINQENRSEHTKEADESKENEIPNEKEPKQTTLDMEVAKESQVMSAEEENMRNYTEDKSKEQEYSGETTYKDLEAAKEPSRITELSDMVAKDVVTDIQEETIGTGNLLQQETEEKTNIMEAPVKLHLKERDDETKHKTMHGEATTLTEDENDSEVKLMAYNMDAPVPTDKDASTSNHEVQSPSLKVSSALDATVEETGNAMEPYNKTAEAYDTDREMVKEDGNLKSTGDISQITKEISAKKQETSSPDFSENKAKNIDEGREYENQQKNNSPDKQKEATIPEIEKGTKYEETHIRDEKTLDLPLTTEMNREHDAVVNHITAATECLEISQKSASVDLIKGGEIRPEIQKQEDPLCIVDKDLPNKPREDESMKIEPLTEYINVSQTQGEPTAKSLNAEADKATNASGTEPQYSSELFEEAKTSVGKDESETENLAMILGTAISQESTKGNLQVTESIIEGRELTQKREGQQVQKEETGDGEVTADDRKEEKDDGETQKMDSCADAPVMVEESEDIDVKVHKKSHNILSGVGSKVKHSIAKVKKAITGKSSHPKPTSPKQTNEMTI